MCWCLLGPVLGKLRRLHRPEVLHQDVPLRTVGEPPDAGLDAELDGAHQLVGLDLLVGHLPRLGVDPTVADLSVSLTVGIRFLMPHPPPLLPVNIFTLIF